VKRRLRCIIDAKSERLDPDVPRPAGLVRNDATTHLPCFLGCDERSTDAITPVSENPPHDFSHQTSIYASRLSRNQEQR